MAWLIYGSVVRYSPSGKRCSGDYLTEDDFKIFSFDRPWEYNPYLLRTGELMATMLIFLISFYGCLFCCGICACTAVLCGYRRELS